MDSCGDAENAREAVAVVDRPKHARFVVGGFEWIHVFGTDECGVFFVNTATGLVASDDPGVEPVTAPRSERPHEASRAKGRRRR